MNILIVGGDQIGSYLALQLLKDGHHVKVVEIQKKHLETLRHHLPWDTAVPGHFTDTKALETAGIHQADLVVALTPTDEGNLVVATLARFEYGVKRVIARVNNSKNSWLFTPEMGVDLVLDEAVLISRVVTEQISIPQLP